MVIITNNCLNPYLVVLNVGIARVVDEPAHVALGGGVNAVTILQDTPSISNSASTRGLNWAEAGVKLG